MSFNKPSALPSTPQTPDETESAFLALNQEVFDQLVSFVDFAPDRFIIGFAEVNFAPDRVALIEALKQHPRSSDIQFAVLDFPDPNLRFLRDAILAELPKIQIDPAKKLLLVVTGLEQSIGMLGDYPPVLQDLNYIRDAFTTSVPHPMLFCLPDYALTRLARFAPDFWAWRIGVFRFESDAATVDRALSQTLQSERIRESLEVAEKHERIDLLLRLLMQYAPSGQPESDDHLKTRLEILNDLGVVYRDQGEVEKAEGTFKKAIEIATDEESLSQIKATVFHELAILKANQGEIEAAIDLYEQSLVIEERIGNAQGIAATLHCMAILKANQGEIEAAIDLYEQSLVIKERIGDAQGIAATLHQMASLKANQGEIEAAIDLYEQSLVIKERIGNAQGIAATLHQMASLKANQGEIEAAIDLYEQSLVIKERIGDAQGKAATLHQMASLKANQGEIEAAIDLYEQSLVIKERIGDAQGIAATLHQMASLKANQGEIEAAIDLFQQSLDIEESIGNVYGKAMTLQWLGWLAADVQKDFDAALTYLQSSLEILQKLQSPKAVGAKELLDRVQKMKAEQENP